MAQYIAFLRGINLGNRRIKMDRLRELFEELKFANVGTFIASGNVVFESAALDTAKLEKRIEAHLEKQLGYNVDTFVRNRTEVGAATAHQPFRSADMEGESNTIHVGFLKAALAPASARALIDCRTEVDEFVVHGREFYWLCRIKTHESKVWTSRQMKAVGLPTATMRNLKMLRKLVLEFPA